MASNDKAVLILCSAFPPFPGIGGRRWAKFAKYFSNFGVTCHVINAFNYSKNVSTWHKDVQAPNIIVHTLKFRFQYWLGLNSKSLFYRIISKLLRTAIYFTKYSPYYASSLSRKLIVEKSIAVIKQNNIKTVIVSGDPYLMYYAILLKKHCNVRVILDYRDLWNDLPDYALNEFHKLTSGQRKFFEFCENEALRNCDDVVCVFTPMVQTLTERLKDVQKSLHIISSGFDKDDFKGVSKEIKKELPITLYFGGNIIPGKLADYFLLFLKSYSSLRQANNSLWEKFRIIINGDCPAYFWDELQKLNDPNIIYEKGFLATNLYLNKLNSSDFGIISIPDILMDCFFITKMFDYLYLKKPVIYLGKKGKVLEYIEQNGIGKGFNPEEKSEVFFENLLNKRSSFIYSEKLNAQIEQDYDIKNLTVKYLNLIFGANQV